MQTFFELQEAAHRRTKTLLGLMVAAVLAVGASIYLIAIFVIPSVRSGQFLEPQWYQPIPLALSVSGTTLFVAIAGAIRMHTLRVGGSRVAKSLGGRLLRAETQDSLETRLLNVVEEMAIASGMQMPRVFVLDDEPGINAFAAGLTLDDAVICVTRGCLEKLTRDELQGVVGHEFSHILNGDMRLNMHLMAAVFGLVCIALLGRMLMEVDSGRRRDDDDDSSSKNGPSIAHIGLALWLVGSWGEFWGKVIKSAVSRQREFLADASALQFTRNPQGIAGALKKIAGYGQHSVVRAARAEELSHFFFGDIRKRSFVERLFATHPTLLERIRRFEPSFSKQDMLLISVSRLRRRSRQERPERYRGESHPGAS